MLKLVRLALTAAVLTAILVRLRRRARPASADPQPAPSSDPKPRRSLAPWGAALAALLVLAGCSQFLNDAAFGNKPGTSVTTGASGYCDADPELCDRIGDSTREADMELVLRQFQSTAPSSSPDPVLSDPGLGPDAACHPLPQAPAVRPLNPKVRAAVDRQWRRIEKWLKAKAPVTHGRLAPPARPAAIAAAEAKLGVRFPDALRASLLRHDGNRQGEPVGTGFGFLGHWNMSIKEIRDTWQMMCEIDDVDEGAPREAAGVG